MSTFLRAELPTHHLRRDFHDKGRGKFLGKDDGVLNKQLRRASRQLNLEGYLNFCLLNIERMELPNLITALYRLAKVSIATPFQYLLIHDFRFQMICRSIHRLLREQAELSSEEVSCLLWTYAVLGIRDETQGNLLGRRIADKIASFEATELVNILWAYAKLNISAADVVSALLPHIGSQRSRFNLNSLISITWSLAAMDREKGLTEAMAEGYQFLLSVAKCFEEQAFLLSAGELASVAWSMCTLFQVVLSTEDHCQPSGSDDENDEESLALARKQFLKIVGDAAYKKVDYFHFSWGLSNFLWSFAVSEFPHEALFNAIAARLKERVDPKEELARITAEKRKRQDDGASENRLCNDSPFDRIERLRAPPPGHEGRLPRIHLLESNVVCNILWAFAAVRLVDEELIDLVDRVLQERIDECNGTDISNAVWSFATLFTCSQKPGSGGVVSKADDCPSYPNSPDAAPYHLELCRRVAKRVLTLMGEMSLHEITNVVWGLTKMNVMDPLPGVNWIQRVCKAVNYRLRSQPKTSPMDGKSLASLLRSVISAHITKNIEGERPKNERELLEVLCEAIRGHLDSLKVQESISILKSLAMAGHCDTGIVQHVGRAFYSWRGLLKPHDLVGIVTSFSRLGVRDATFFNQAASLASEMKFLASFPGNDLADLLQCLLERKCVEKNLYSAVGKVVSSKAHELPPSLVARFVWIFAEAGVTHKLMLRTVSPVLSEATRNQKLDSDSLSTALWGFAAVSFTCDELMLAGTKVVKNSGMASWKPQACATLVWALSMANSYDEEVMEMVISKANKEVIETNKPGFKKDKSFVWTTRQVSHLAVSAATVRAGRRAMPAFRRFWEKTIPEYVLFVEASPTPLPSREKAQICWSLAISEEWKLCPDVFEELVGAHIWWTGKPGQVPLIEKLRSSKSGLQLQNLSQVYLAELAYTVLDSRQTGLLSDVDRSACYEAFSISAKQQADARHSLSAVNVVAGALRSLDIIMLQQAITEDGVCVDFLLTGDCCLEVHDASCFIRNLETGERKLSGPSWFKMRVLEKLGWRVLTVPYAELCSENQSETVQSIRSYIRGILKEAGFAVANAALREDGD